MQHVQSDSAFRIWWKFILINLGIASMLIFFFCPTCLFSWEGIKAAFPHFVYAFTISNFLSLGGFVVDSYLDKKIPWVKYPIYRLLITIAVFGVYCFFICLIIVFLFFYFRGFITLDKIPWGLLIENTKVPAYIGLGFMAFFTTRSWLFEWRNAALETEKLKREKLASQYQSLKDQLNPHFLFNSLNALSHLVYESADRSAEFIQQLSRIYRYVLDVQQQQLVSLDEELDFAENYLCLQKIRFEGLAYKLEITDVSGYHLPPLSLQLLLENAIKHNVASRDRPLTIHLQQSGATLMVKNNLQPKNNSTETKSGIGLQNIDKRYALLSNKKILINQTEEDFTVSLPLLTLEQK